MPSFFRRSSSPDEPKVDVTDRSKLNKRAVQALEDNLTDGDQVRAIVPGGGSAIVALDRRMLVLHTGRTSNPIVHRWDIAAVTGIYASIGSVTKMRVVLYGPSVEESDNVWLPGDSAFGPVQVFRAANAIMTTHNKEATAAVRVMRDLLPNPQETNWDELRRRREARVARLKAEKHAEEAAERAAVEAAKAAQRAGAAMAASGLTPESFEEFRSQSPAMMQAGIRPNDLLQVYRSIQRGDLVIVRKYLQLRGGAKGGMLAFQAEANLLAAHGYVPTTQGFAANNALTGVSVGSGEIIVSYSKRPGQTP